jgi:hypothetical protein
MEESVFDTTNEVLLSFVGLAVSAKGSVAVVVAVAVSVLIIAVAWRVIMFRRG